MWALLDASEDASPVDAVEAVTAQLAAALDTERVSLLIADLSGRALSRLAHDGQLPTAETRRHGVESAQHVPIDEGIVEQTVRSQRPVTVRENHRWRTLAPVTQRGEILGLLEVVQPREPDDRARELISRTAHLLSFVVIANARHTDLFEWGRRATLFELSAEIQRRLLPSALTCEAGAFTLSAWLEPAATNGGDSFDYSLERDLLHLSVTDAMGEGVQAALTATLCVGSLRNSRRHGSSLTAQATAADLAIREHAPGRFATGLLGRLNLSSGVLTLLNAGHELPYLGREGTVRETDLPVDRPLGLAAQWEYRTTDLQLLPGDRVVILTDGMVERRAAALDFPSKIAETRQLHPRESVRALADAVLDVAGPTLQDDASALILDWHGHHELQRHSHAGATDDQPRSWPPDG